MTGVSKERIERAARALARARYLDFCEAFKGDIAGAERYADINWEEHYSHDARLALTADAPAIDSARAEEREACAIMLDIRAKYYWANGHALEGQLLDEQAGAIRARTPVTSERK